MAYLDETGLAKVFNLIKGDIGRIQDGELKIDGSIQTLHTTNMVVTTATGEKIYKVVTAE